MGHALDMIVIASTPVIIRLFNREHFDVFSFTFYIYGAQWNKFNFFTLLTCFFAYYQSGSKLLGATLQPAGEINIIAYNRIVKALITAHITNKCLSCVYSYTDIDLWKPFFL